MYVPLRFVRTKTYQGVLLWENNKRQGGVMYSYFLSEDILKYFLPFIIHYAQWNYHVGKALVSRGGKA